MAQLRETLEEPRELPLGDVRPAEIELLRLTSHQSWATKQTKLTNCVSEYEFHHTPAALVLDNAPTWETQSNAEYVTPFTQRAGWQCLTQ